MYSRCGFHRRRLDCGRNCFAWCWSSGTGAAASAGAGFPPQFLQLFRQARKFPRRIQRHLPLAAQFQLSQQLRLPQPVFLRPSFSPASPGGAAAFWRCPSGRRQIPARRRNESANANRPARASVPASVGNRQRGRFVGRRCGSALGFNRRCSGRGRSGSVVWASAQGLQSIFSACISGSR